MSLDHVLPVFDRAERHRRSCDAPERALAAVRLVRPADIPGFRLLMGLRSAGALGRRSFGTASLWDLGGAVGFRALEETPDRVIAGAIGQFWRLRGGEWARFDGRTGFIGFDEAGYAKAAIGFWVDGSELVTETRVLGTDQLSARRMARYWLLIRPGSGLIRRGWLRAADKRSAP